MNNYGREVKVQALGQEWTFARLERRRLREFRDWIATQLPDPMGIGKEWFDKLPLEEQLAAVKKNEQNRVDLKCFHLACPLCLEYMSRDDGLAKLAHILLKPNHPDVDEDTAFEVFTCQGKNEVEKILNMLQGETSGRGNSEAPAAG